MKTGLVYDKRFLNHETGHHPECPARLEWIHRHLESHGITANCEAVEFLPAEREAIEIVHLPDQVDRVLQLSSQGGGFIDADTVVSADSASIAFLAAGAGQSAVKQVLSGDFEHVMCLARPPGHHATPTRSMGFCLFNNIAIAAEEALHSDDVNRVAIIDFDVHHGNGTQDCFYNRKEIFFASIHQYPHYPGTGSSNETGAGEGMGTTLNLPLPGGVDVDRWFEAFRKSLDAVANYDPDLLLVSAGFDGHKKDPLGDFPLDDDDYQTVGKEIARVAEGKGIVSFLEGGYHLESLARSVVAYVQAFL